MERKSEGEGGEQKGETRRRLGERGGRRACEERVRREQRRRERVRVREQQRVRKEKRVKSEGLSFIRLVILSIVAQEFTTGHHLMHTLLTPNFS